MSPVWKQRISPEAGALSTNAEFVRDGTTLAWWSFDLDTASRVTILGACAARDIGIHDAPTKARPRLWSFGGPDRGFRDVLPEIRVMNATLRNVQVVVHELPRGHRRRDRLRHPPPRRPHRRPALGPPRVRVPARGVNRAGKRRPHRLLVDRPWGLLEFAWLRAA